MKNINSKIKDMIENGFSITRAAFAVGIKYTDCLKIVNENNYTIFKEHLNEQKLINLYEKGASSDNLAMKFNISTRKTKEIIGKESMRDNKIVNKILSINDNIFNTIDTPEKSYWLGWLFSDGSVRNNLISLRLEENDLELIKQFAIFVNYPEYRISKHSKIMDGKVYYGYGISIRSDKMSNDLINLGCVENKSLVVKYPAIDHSMNKHFILGYFCGDGSLFISKDNEWSFSLAGTKEMLLSIKDILEKELPDIYLKLSDKPITKSKNNTHSLIASSEYSIISIMNWLMSDIDTSIILKRKYEKYKEMSLFFKERRSGMKKKDYIRWQDRETKDIPDIDAIEIIIPINKKEKNKFIDNGLDN